MGHLADFYGGDPAKQAELRAGAGGKLKLTDDGRLPLDENGFDLTGNNNNWWIGLSVLHSVFAREHNAVCDMLAARPIRDRSDDRLFHTARLVIAALMTKIRPPSSGRRAMLDTTLLQYSDARQLVGHPRGDNPETASAAYLGEAIYISGIMGSKTDHHDVRYAITEEFVAVYRMHPLLPDELFHA